VFAQVCAFAQRLRVCANYSLSPFPFAQYLRVCASLRACAKFARLGAKFAQSFPFPFARLPFPVCAFAQSLRKLYAFPVSRLRVCAFPVCAFAQSLRKLYGKWAVFVDGVFTP